MKTYVFEVRFVRRPQVSRTIEVRADQTLAALHGAIQESICWNNDHLYSFFFTPRPQDWVNLRRSLHEKYDRIAGSGASARQLAALHEEVERELKTAKMEYACAFELEPPRRSSSTRLSSLGLAHGMKFEYLFDYGDCHWFDVEVVEEREAKSGMKYPRVIARHGRAPQQYPPCKRVGG